MTWNIWLLITLSSCVSGSFVVYVTQSSYQAEENHNATMEWTFQYGSLSTLYIFCEMFNGVTRAVLLDLQEGVEVSESQDKRFTGRVQFDKYLLKEGRLIFYMFRLMTNDSGVYVCTVNTGDGESSRTSYLNVTAERDRPKPETPNSSSGGRDPSTTGSPSQLEKPNTTSGGRDSSTTGSPSQPERPNTTSGGRDSSQKESLSQTMSPGSIALRVVGLIVVVVGTLLGVRYCRCKNQQDAMIPSPSIELDPMLPSI